MRPPLLGCLLLAAVVAPAWSVAPAAAVIPAAAVLPVAEVVPVAAVVLDRPVPGPVTAVFDAPTRYGPGHRGVDLVAPLGSPVRASAGGRITFAGRVVDATWVTIDHGLVRTTVGPMRTVRVSRGQLVARGQVVGTSGHAHGRPAVHWSARRGDTYVDPLGVGRVLATLVPTAPSDASTRGPSTRGWPGRRVR